MLPRHLARLIGEGALEDRAFTTHHAGPGVVVARGSGSAGFPFPLSRQYHTTLISTFKPGLTISGDSPEDKVDISWLADAEAYP